jgi:hypothetical protein
LLLAARSLATASCANRNPQTPPPSCPQAEPFKNKRLDSLLELYRAVRARSHSLSGTKVAGAMEMRLISGRYTYQPSRAKSGFWHELLLPMLPLLPSPPKKPRFSSRASVRFNCVCVLLLSS